MERVLSAQTSLRTFVWRSIACQMTTYFVIGWLASSALSYSDLFGSGAWQHMRSVDSVWVAAGPALQCLRGCLFGLVLWPVRGVWLDERHGWAQIWAMFVGLAILGPTAAAPGSLEGVVYTNWSLSDHLLGLPETGTQTLLYCLLFQRWYRHPGRWWSSLMIAGVIVIVCFSALGALAALYPGAFQP